MNNWLLKLVNFQHLYQYEFTLSPLFLGMILSLLKIFFQN